MAVDASDKALNGFSEKQPAAVALLLEVCMTMALSAQSEMNARKLSSDAKLMEVIPGWYQTLVLSRGWKFSDTQ